jgi:hypothetical protein
LDSGCGVYAPDYESYKVFAKLFDPIIEEYHGFGPKDKQPPVDLGETHINELPPLDPQGKYIISTRIRCGRTLNGYPFNPLLKEDDYLEMQKKVKSALENVKDKDLKGVYYPLGKFMQKLIKFCFYFRGNEQTDSKSADSGYVNLSILPLYPLNFRSLPFQRGRL